MKINDYIESGILESYVLGSASEAEAEELLYLRDKHPEIKEALFNLEIDIERMAGYMAIKPPPEVWMKIEYGINEIVKTPDFEPLNVTKHPAKNGNHSKEGGKSGQYIDVDSKSSHMRVHKIWRWILIAIFALGKLFLGFAIFFYLENRQIKQEIQELKQELKEIKSRNK